jgi:hypothetical protein
VNEQGLSNSVSEVSELDAPVVKKTPMDSKHSGITENIWGSNVVEKPITRQDQEVYDQYAKSQQQSKTNVKIEEIK